MKIKDFEQKTRDALLTCFQDTPVAAPRKTSPRYLYPIRTGGVEELILSASGLSVLDPNLLEKILETYDMRKLWPATGWFLEHFQKDFHVPAEVIEGFANKTPLSPLYLIRNERSGTLSERWKLILPDAFDSLEQDDAS